MLRALGISLLLLAGSAGSAAADNMCGDEPIAPAIASPADEQAKSPADAAAAKHSAFQDIRRWQAELKTYRDCLNASTEADNRKIGETQRGDKPDPDKIKKIQADIASLSQAYGNSTDDEERVVNEFNALSVAYCTRGDVDKASCPKR
jgi:hypothetical protein